VCDKYEFVTCVRKHADLIRKYNNGITCAEIE
jgi:hypothetical protein